VSDDVPDPNFLQKVYRLNEVAAQTRQQAVDTKIQDQEAGRRLSAAYAQEAILKAVSLMRTSTDDSTILKCIKLITDRAWGSPKPLTEEEKKGADGGTILDILASMSAQNKNLEISIKQNAQIAATPKDITPNPDQITDLEGFFEEVKAEKKNE